MAEPVHPRDVFAYEGGGTVEAGFLDALGSGRLHHAWMLCGPEGVGKATFAYRAARRLLGARADAAWGALGASPEDPVSRLVSAQSHPDLMVLERQVENGKTKKFIAVDDARALPEFFSKSPSMAPYRVAIVDAADHLNMNAANALLKTLEEPPERGVLFLVTHAPGRMMATIRSRCRRLTFRPWPDEAVDAFLARHADTGPEERARLTAMAHGAPGRALALAAAKALEADDLARALVEGAPVESELQHAADGFRGAEGQGRFEMLLDRLADAVRDKAAALSAGDPALGQAWAGFWSKVAEAPAEADAINLDRAEVFWTLVAEMRGLRGRERRPAA